MFLNDYEAGHNNETSATILRMYARILAGRHPVRYVKHGCVK